MKIFTFLNGGMETASARERILRYVPGLEREEIHLEIHVAGNIPPGVVGRSGYWLKLARKIRSSDGILIHRVPLSARERRLIRMMGRPAIFDIDDPLWYAVEPGPDGSPQTSPQAEDLFETIKICRMIRAGNDALAEHLENLGIPIRVAPTCVPVPDSEERRPASPDRIQIGWTGNATGFRHFRICSGAIRRLLKENPAVTFTVIAEKPPELEDLPFTFQKWSLEREPDYLDDFDIGIMPLEDDEWSRGKCGYKLLLYMSLGIPSVASPVGVNGQIMENGKTGFLATTEEEWYDALRKLVRDEELRRQMGAAAKASLAGRYDSRTGLDALVRDLRALTPV
jgi:glycosyltransferase involved in cell wall biosynthesis